MLQDRAYVAAFANPFNSRLHDLDLGRYCLGSEQLETPSLIAKSR
ncbi:MULTISPECIES: hypothetical protein [Rhizobium]|uniref:Uncharacterized protein n=1 Tax=Rhizobium hidalgonense TaxID=1538159 RepID=A0AAJ2LN57_9HYPH|nr:MULTISPECIES: hypothetical protein [Rhizobium]MDR9774661.1 hypothetical protein [Rhizobium hidalgonense]MDR9818363.1 hypothetical protein [Rhizobium hidalgonense]